MVAARDSVAPTDLQCLSELPMEQLLKIKKSLKEMSEDVSTVDEDIAGLNRIGKDSSAMADGYLFESGTNISSHALPLMGGGSIK